MDLCGDCGTSQALGDARLGETLEAATLSRGDFGRRTEALHASRVRRERIQLAGQSHGWNVNMGRNGSDQA